MSCNAGTNGRSAGQLVEAVHQVVQGARHRPATRAVVHHQRHDRRQVAEHLVAQQGLPDAQHIAEHAHRHPSIRLALVLDQDVQVERLAGVATRGTEQEIGVALRQVLVDKATGDALELLERDRVEDRRRQHAAQLAGRVDRLAEAELEEAVVVAHVKGYRRTGATVA
jgi:hypothetical protein